MVLLSCSLPLYVWTGGARYSTSSLVRSRESTQFPCTTKVRPHMELRPQAGRHPVCRKGQTYRVQRPLICQAHPSLFMVCGYHCLLWACSVQHRSSEACRKKHNMVSLSSVSFERVWVWVWVGVWEGERERERERGRERERANLVWEFVVYYHNSAKFPLFSRSNFDSNHKRNMPAKEQSRRSYMYEQTVYYLVFSWGIAM